MLGLPDQQKLQQMGAQARKKAEKVGWQYPVRQFEQALYSLDYSIKNTGYKTRKEHQCETPECKD